MKQLFILFLLTFFLANLSLSQNQVGELQKVSAIQTDTITIGTYQTTYDFPLMWDYAYSFGQSIYAASEVGAARSITGIALQIVNPISEGYTFKNTRIFLNHTSRTGYASGDMPIDTAGILCYSANLSIPATAGWVVIPFSTPFAYDGTSNLLIHIQHRNGTASTDPDDFSELWGCGTPPSGVVGAEPTIYKGSSAFPTSSFYRSSMRPLIKIISSSTSTVTPVAAFTADIISGTAPLTVQFTDQSTNTPTSWSWTFGDEGTSTEQNPSHTYNSAGTYTVSLTATNASGSNTLTKNSYITVSTSGGGTSAAIPFAEGFENTWIDKDGGIACAPSTYWTNTPATGYNSWRRSDNWSGGSYTPSGANETAESARFHSFLANSGYSGTLDLAIDFSSASDSKELKFYYINVSGFDQLEVYVSTDGGSDFGTALGTYISTSGWEEKTIQLGALNASNGIIRFKATSDFGNDDIGLDEVSVTAGSTGIADNQIQPTEFKLEQNYPNPFNPSTIIAYSVATETYVTLTVFDILGQQIRTLVQARQSAGRYTVSFDARDLASGLYFYQLSAGSNSTIKKMNLIK